MKISIWFTTLLILCQSFYAMADNANVKMETMDIAQLATGRPIKINLWFPQGTCADTANKKLCLSDSAITNRAIIFSHGAMGSANEYRWVGENLAAQGFVVIGVNHFGESWVYGQDKINPRSSGLIWQRPQDISALLDYLTTHNIFQRDINWSNIIAIGHSAGGQTAAMLAGATFELAQMTDYCKSDQSVNDRSCNYAKNSENAPEEYRKLFRAPQQDQRIKIIVLLDPALGAAANIDSLHKISIPTLVVGAANNDFLPWSNHGLRYATEIPGSKVELLNGQEGHFVFLNQCQHQIKVMDVSLCEDRAGVDRNITHQKLTQVILNFIQINRLALENKTLIIQPKHYTQTASFSEIIMYTPRWVFGLLIALVIFGVMQTRTREVKIQVALILPIAMLILSLTGVLRYVGWQFPALACWLLGITIASVLSIKWIGKNIARFNPESRKLIIQGSWLPLVVILGIFVTRYTLGVATAMQWEITHKIYFSLVVSLILGIWSGFFLARCLIFWNAKN